MVSSSWLKCEGVFCDCLILVVRMNGRALKGREACITGIVVTVLVCGALMFSYFLTEGFGAFTGQNTTSFHNKQINDPKRVWAG